MVCFYGVIDYDCPVGPGSRKRDSWVGQNVLLGFSIKNSVAAMSLEIGPHASDSRKAR